MSEVAATQTPEGVHWYCVRAKPKREHIAARCSLRLLPDLEAFCPRLRFARTTRRGRVWFCEALFPGYLFARFALGLSQRAVAAATGVTGLVHFGEFTPFLSDGGDCHTAGGDCSWR
jgi:transcriptional antiterminator RfaH